MRIKVYLIHRVPGMKPGSMNDVGSEVTGTYVRGDVAGFVLEEDDTDMLYWIPTTNVSAMEVIEDDDE